MIQGYLSLSHSFRLFRWSTSTPCYTMKFSSLFLATLFAAPFVSAHGVLRRITIQGKVFEGNLPGRTGKDSVIRLVDRQDPNYGAQNLALTCGHNSAEAALFADAKPGDTITFAWKTASDGNVC